MAEAGAEPARQGLFLCLPAGSLDTDQFTQSGPAADMPPDPLLASIINTVTGEDAKGLAGLSVGLLIGVIAAVRRLESRVAWYLLAAVGEFTARTVGEPCAAEFAADQLACELHLTSGLRRRPDGLRPHGRPKPLASRPPTPRCTRAQSTRCTSG